MDLFPYQSDGAEWLTKQRTALLADEPGLGKTAQAIRAADMRGAKIVQVICPAAVTEGWRREFARFQTVAREILPVDQDDPDFPARVIVSSFERTERGIAFWQTGSPIDYLIIDEGHYLKSRETKRTKAIYGPECTGVGGLVERAGGVAVLTGTPSPNNPAELWPMLRALAPERIYGMRGPASYWGFVDRYCHTKPGRFGGLDIIRGKNLPELRERIAPFVLRRKTDDVLRELPRAVLDELPLRDADAARALRNLEGSEDGARIGRVLEEKGVEGLRSLSPHVASLRRLTGISKAPAVAKWVTNWFSGGGEKIALFAYHTEVIETLAKLLAPFKPIVIDGGVPGTKRQGLVDAFVAAQHKTALIGQITAAGTGLDGMQHATRDLLFVESSWVDDENKQVIRRLRRIGQQNAVRVRFATMPGSLDERIQRACLRKAEDARKLFD